MSHFPCFFSRFHTFVGHIQVRRTINKTCFPSQSLQNASFGPHFFLERPNPYFHKSLCSSLFDGSNVFKKPFLAGEITHFLEKMQQTYGPSLGPSKMHQPAVKLSHHRADHRGHHPVHHRAIFACDGIDRRTLTYA